MIRDDKANDILEMKSNLLTVLSQKSTIDCLRGQMCRIFNGFLKNDGKQTI